MSDEQRPMTEFEGGIFDAGLISAKTGNAGLWHMAEILNPKDDYARGFLHAAQHMKGKRDVPRETILK